MTTHTPAPLTYEKHIHSGENWLVAFVDFGPDDEGRAQHFVITTDHVPTSEDVMGDPEADVRLWAAAPDLLRALMDVCQYWYATQNPGTLPLEYERGVQAIAKARGEVTPC